MQIGAFSYNIVRMSEELEPQLISEAPHLLGISPDGQRGTESPKGAGLAFIWETLKVVAISLAIILPIRYFLVQPFFVKGASMEPTFEDGNYILIDEITYRFSNPERGEVVVFRFPEDKSQFFIKRIIGMPEETVEIKNNKVIIYNKNNPAGSVLDECRPVSTCPAS